MVSVASKYPAVTRVLSSPYLRCVQTMQPLVAALGLKVEVVPALQEGQSSSAVALVRSLAGADAALCTHGDVIVEILVALADEDRLDLGPNPRQAKGSVWVLDGGSGSFTSALYFPPVLVETV